MAPTNEQRIIAKAVTEGDYVPLSDRNVTESWFLNPTTRDAFRFIADHVNKYGNVPTKTTIQTQMGTTFAIFAVAESFDYLLDTQAEMLRWQVSKSMLPEVEDLLGDNRTGDALAAIDNAVSRANQFQATPSRVVDAMAVSRGDERWKAYQDREAGGSLLGYSTGFPTIDSTTLGLQAGQLVTVLAQPKVGKTTLCLVMASHIYDHHEEPVLFVSFEMGIRELEMRQEALMAQINFKDLQSGNLSKMEKRKYERYVDLLKTDYHWPFWFMDASSGSTVSAIRAQIERLDPAVVFLDGIYMMTDETTGEQNTAQALTNITRSLKRLATQVQKPIVINTQALPWKSKGPKITMDSAGYSSSFAQDSDVVLGIERVPPGKDEEESDVADQRILKVLASRNSGLTRVRLSFSYEFGQIEEAEEVEE